MMLRDSRSNLMKANGDWGITHFSWIYHSLHLVSCPYLLIATKQRDSRIESNTTLISEDCEHVDSEFEQVDEDVNNTYEDLLVVDVHLVLEDRNLVQEPCRFCVFPMKSTKCIEKMKFLQKELNGSINALKVKSDVWGWWNSTFEKLL